jgi:hypothetical protein
MTKRLMTMVLGAALAIGISAASYAQIGGSSGGASGNRSDDTSTMHGGTTGKGPAGSATTGQGASQFAPGHAPGAAKDANPGHGSTPPGQQMHKEEQKGTSTSR